MSSMVQSGTISRTTRTTWIGTRKMTPIVPTRTAVIRRGIAIPQIRPTANASSKMAAIGKIPYPI